MILNEVYNRALDYAKGFSPLFYRDVVHDALVHWFNKTEKSLFDEPEPIVMHIVKKTYWKKYSQKPLLVFSDRHRQNTVTPEDEFIQHEEELPYHSASQYVFVKHEQIKLFLN